MHLRAGSSVHDSDLPDFPPDIRDDQTPPSTEDDSSDYINAKQAVEYVNNQAHAVEAAEYEARMIHAMEEDEEEKKRMQAARLEAVGSALKIIDSRVMEYEE